MTAPDILKAYSWSLVGKPYVWGGEGVAFDCSGLCLELMWAMGIGPGYDMTANSIRNFLRRNGSASEPRFGALSFYGTKKKITHMGFCIDHKYMIEAGGGGSKVKTVEDAIKYGATVRIRPTLYRGDYIECYMPRWPFN